MKVEELVKMYKIRPHTIYRIIRDMEMMEEISVKRKGRIIDLDSKNAKIIKKEIERRGYEVKNEQKII